MRTVPAGWAAALTRSQIVSSKADVLRLGAVVYPELPIVGGSVKMDRSAAIQRTCDLTLVQDPNKSPVVPSGPTSPTAPYGNELRVYRGLEVAGVMSMQSLGVFGISSDETSDEGSQQVHVVGYDRSRRVARNQFIDPWVIAAGTNYTTAIDAIVNDRLPGVAHISTATAEVTPLLVLDAGADPWEEVTKMAAAIGFECYFDGNGEFVLRPVPDPTSTPVSWAYSEGTDATLLSVNKAYSDEPGYNGVVLSAESTTLAVPIRAVVWDTDPSSPTYYLGPYGMVPKFVTSPYVASTPGATAAATAELQASIGGTELVTFAAIPNPAHELGDVVSVTRAGSSVAAVSTVEQLEVPLSPSEQMTISTKQKRVAA